jgi:ArsR family transcriptional regulator
MSNNQTNDLDALAQMFKALSNPQRLRIFLRLATCCVPSRCCTANIEGIRRCVGDLGENLDLAASTVSHHIKELRRAGLINVERRGQKIECWISEDTLQLLASFFTCAVEEAEELTTGENHGR